MKKSILSIFTLVILFTSLQVYGQAYTFSFSQFTATYTPIVGGTNLYGSTPWNNAPVINLPIGFNFNFQGQVQTTADMIPGIIAFPPNVDNMGVYVFGANLADTGSVVSQSPVYYQTTGTVGNRILKVECVDAGFLNEYFITGSYSSVVNFQVWLYEVDNSIEVRMGPSVIQNPFNCYDDSTSPGPSIGPLELNAAQTVVLYSYLLAGNPAAPGNAVFNLNNPPPTLNGTPSNGTVYRFAQVVTGINENEQVFGSVGLFPNPANENTHLVYTVKNAGHVQIEIKDMQGRIVSNEQVGNQSTGTYNHQINTANLASGIYFITLVSGEQKIPQKISVTH
jgi:Secretion system C-terminal sorting domain